MDKSESLKKRYKAKRGLNRATKKSHRHIITSPLSLDKPIVHSNAEQMKKDYAAKENARKIFRKTMDQSRESLRKDIGKP